MANTVVTQGTINEENIKELRERMKLIANADPSQFHNDFSLRRYLKAFKTVDAAFQAILKTNKWRAEYNVSNLSLENLEIKKHFNKARVLRHRDLVGRPVIYIPARNHNVNDRNIEELTKFIVFCLTTKMHLSFYNFFLDKSSEFTFSFINSFFRILINKYLTNLKEEACKKCFEEVIDNLCIVFDLKDFGLSCMDYQIVKNLIWLLSKHYPERLGICLIVNAPPLFNTCWVVIKGWLDENTSSKVTFVYSEEELCKYLIPDILPEM